MRQVLNIFVKDVRHYWRECAASIALVAVFGWNEMRGWLHDEVFGAAIGIGGLFSSRFLSGLVVVLVPVAWSLVVVRVIQGESLVGDRQFWVTRPYEWKKLLAAKVLFGLMFVNLPLLVLDVFLLAKAGFRPTNYIVGLFWMQLMIALYFMLPVAALATVTATIVQMLLALLIIVLYGIGMGILSDQIPSSSFSDPADSLTAALFFGVCLAVVWMQYARRKTNKSRLLIAGLAGVCVLILVATPYRTLVAREFPQLNLEQERPFQLALLPAEKADLETAPQKEEEKEVEIRLPLSVSGLGAESIAAIDGFMVDLEAQDGLHWNSGWKSPGLSLFPDQKSTRIDVTLKRSAFERLRSSPVRLRLSIAFTLFHDTNRREFVTPAGVFIMKDVGLCSTESIYSRGIHCLAPLRRPKSLLLSADMSMSTCPVPEGESPATHGEIARDWTRGSGSEPAEFGISPLKTVDLYLTDWNGAASRRSTGICPGTPFVLSNPEPVGRNQFALQIDGLRLSDYRLPSPKFTLGSVSIRAR
jgi:hypothetical protein